MWLVSPDGGGGTVVSTPAAKESHVTSLWQLFVSGAVGSSLTYAFTWWRERRRMQDAYRAPQRQAIGDILASAHEFQLRALNWRRALTDLIAEIRQDRADNLPTISAEIREKESAYAEALMGMRRAFEVGSLTVVDVRCWQEMVVAVSAFSRFDVGVAEVGVVITSADEAEQFVAQNEECAKQLRVAVSALVKTANERVTPVASRRARRQRRSAQRQLAEFLRDGASKTPKDGPDL